METKIILVFLFTINRKAILDAAESTTWPIANDAIQYFKTASGIMDKQCGPFGFFNCFDGRCSCYLVLPAKNFYNEASKYCQLFQGQLTTLSSLEEIDFVASLLERSNIQEAWIGLNRSNSNAEFEWADKSAIVYSTLKRQTGNCVQLTMKNNWVPNDCIKTAAAFVCEVPFESTELKDTCRPGWGKFGDHCYQIQKDKRTWDEAQAHCKTLSSNLVSIHSYEERAFMGEMMWRSGVYDSWIGLRLDLQTKKFYWVDGTVKNFIDWRPDQLNNLQEKEECVGVRNYDRRWNDLHCSEQLSYICKTDLNPTKT